MADSVTEDPKPVEDAKAAQVPPAPSVPPPESGAAQKPAEPTDKPAHLEVGAADAPTVLNGHVPTSAPVSDDSPITVIDIGVPPSSAPRQAQAPAEVKPLAPAPDSPFGGPDFGVAGGGAIASASHLPTVGISAPERSNVSATSISGSPVSSAGSARAPSSYIPMPSGIIPMPSGVAWQKVTAGITVAPPQAVLAAKGLRKRFGKREVVRGVEIEVGAGEIVGLLGRNGAGKTTTFRMIMGLLHPDGGTVMYENRDISRKPMYERANRGIGYLAQQPSIFQRLSVENNLLAILELQEPNKVKRYQRLEELIVSLGLVTVRKSMASVLSGGERRRLEIARAMSLKPKIVLFDEPFAGIDPIAVSEIQGILRDLKTQGVGVLLTDHNVRETLTITDRTYIMDEGVIWIHGAPRDIVANPDARARYLGHDFRLDF